MACEWQIVHISQNVQFRVPIGLEFVKKLGSGAFGSVAAFRKAATGEKVAVKKIARAFDCLIDAKRSLREIKLLRSLKHENIISIIDMFLPESRNFEDIYIVQEFMETDLHKVIQSNQTLTKDHHQYFIYQILIGVDYLHRSNVVHRDLKPANVLVNMNCDIKICDFGLGRVCWNEQLDLSDYVVTRWWRAPEVVLLPSAYSSAVDIWSIGCILAELLGRKPIFRGRDHVDQLKTIFQVLGAPSDFDLAFLPPPPCPARTFVAKLPNWPMQQWSTLFPEVGGDVTEALDAMLRVNPMHRIDARDAIKLPWFQNIFDESDLTSGQPITSDWMMNDMKNPTKHLLQSKIYAECCTFHPDHVPLARIVELHPSALAEDGSMVVRCNAALSGDTLTSLVSQPGEKIGDLRTKLSNHLDEPEELLQLVASNGRAFMMCDDETSHHVLVEAI